MQPFAPPGRMKSSAARQLRRNAVAELNQWRQDRPVRPSVSQTTTAQATPRPRRRRDGVSGGVPVAGRRDRPGAAVTPSASRRQPLRASRHPSRRTRRSRSRSRSGPRPTARHSGSSPPLVGSPASIPPPTPSARVRWSTQRTGTAFWRWTWRASGSATSTPTLSTGSIRRHSRRSRRSMPDRTPRVSPPVTARSGSRTITTGP